MAHNVLPEPPRRIRPRRERRRKPMRAALWLILGVAVAITLMFAAFFMLRPMLESLGGGSEEFNGPPGDPVLVEVAEGDTGAAIARTLQDEGVIKTVAGFTRSASANPAAASIQPGRYELPTNIPSAEAIDLLLDPNSRRGTGVLIREGLRASEIYELVAEAIETRPEDVQTAAEQLPLPADAQGNPEGFLFPATYDLLPGTTAEEAVQSMFERCQAAMQELGVSPADQHEVLTKAAIVQAKAGNIEDMGKVARVIENRLDIGQALQMDSTVHYAVDSRSVVSTTPTERQVDSPYNTYLYPGLPAGPIGSPGSAAIEAVLDPTPGDWRYFVTVDSATGETKFATSKREHDRNVAQWRNNS